MEDLLSNLINTYHELNAAIVDILQEEPSPLEFMRYVACNRPFVVRSSASDWDALKKWNADYLREAMDGQGVKVTITPNGNADAVVEMEDGSLAFVEPHETYEDFGEFLNYVQADSNYPGDDRDTKPVKYAQTQNDNLRNEYRSLFEDVPNDIPFARIALQKNADAVNMWIGNERSVTSLHKDNYENIYIQIRGQKHFVLLSPVEMPCVNERMLPKGRYVQRGEGAAFAIETYSNDDLVPVPTWDPDEPDQRTTVYSHLASPLRVTLNEGDMLYLPAMWYHKVSQTTGSEKFACAINYWYDMDFTGQFWATNSFIREMVEAKNGSTCKADIAKNH